MVEKTSSATEPVAEVKPLSGAPKCRFDIAWVGRCQHRADESGYCGKHKGIECCVCKEQASHDCSHTGQFVCGQPLCSTCEGYERKPGDEGYNDAEGFSWGFRNHVHRRKPTNIAAAQPTEDHKA